MSYKDKVRFAWGAGSGYKATKMYSQYPITDKATFDAAAFDVSRTTTPTVSSSRPRVPSSSPRCKMTYKVRDHASSVINLFSKCPTFTN